VEAKRGAANLNFIAGLIIFPHYSLDLEVLYGSVDGQKFESPDPTIKARYSRKYFGRDKGVVGIYSPGQPRQVANRIDRRSRT
jgi:hypothetical protein